MSDRIDAELERLSKEGKTPKLIRVGHELHLELDSEINPVFAAELLSDGQKATPITRDEVTDYKGIRVEIVEDAAPDYLEVVT
jgi:hypothetical protein